MTDLNQATAHVHKALPNSQRLAGFLRKCKVGSKGPIAFRRRYFSLQDGNANDHNGDVTSSCRLQYYRGSNDRLPLGEIDISRASFAISFTKVQGSDFSGVPLSDCSPWVFEIRAQGNIYLLEAKDRHTLRYWLQELQASRRNYSRQRLNLIRSHSDNNMLGGEIVTTIEKPTTPIEAEQATEVTEHCNPTSLSAPTILEFSVSQPTSPTTSNSQFYLPTPCMECIKLREEVNKSVSDAIFYKENFTAATELLQKQHVKYDELNRKLTTATNLSNESHVAYEIACDKDQHISRLEIKILDLDEETERLKRDVENEKQSNAILREEIEMFRLSVTSKDQVVATYMMNQPNLNTESEVQRKDDICDAYKEQNRFLNQEILELTQIRENDRDAENSLRSKWRDTEMKYYTAQSNLIKTLGKFKELKTNVQDVKEGSPESFCINSDLSISEMLNDAMMDPTFPLSPISGSSLMDSTGPISYDSRGFLNDEIFTDSVKERADLYKLKSNKIKFKSENQEVDTSNRIKWENYFLQLSDRIPIYNNQIKSLVRTSGIPDQYRESIWLSCIQHHLSDNVDYNNPTYYETLLKQKNYEFNSAHKQIELDLLRTLPNNKHYQNINSDKINQLRRVLIAYSTRNPYVGYCQGLNRLAALSLLFLDEVNSFWCLALIVEYLMPQGYYSLTLSAAHADQNVLKELFAIKLPKLHIHFSSLQIDVTSFTFNWFLTIFVDNVSPEIYLRIWDSFLYEGSKVLFRMALAFFKYTEADLLKIDDQINCLNYLRILPVHIVDINLLFRIAFVELNPFPMKNINSRRANALEDIKAQLEKIAKIRSQIKVKRKPDSESDSQ